MPVGEQWIISTWRHLGPSGAGGRVLRRQVVGKWWASAVPEGWGVGRPPSMSFLHQDLLLKRESVISGSPNTQQYLPHQSLEFREFSPEKKILILEDTLHKHSLVSSKTGLWKPGISNLTHLTSAWQHCIMKKLCPRHPVMFRCEDVLDVYLNVLSHSASFLWGNLPFSSKCGTGVSLMVSCPFMLRGEHTVVTESVLAWPRWLVQRWIRDPRRTT